MQHRVSRLQVRDLIDANLKVKELRDLRARIRYNIIETKFNYTECSYYDDSFNISSYQRYGQTGTVTDLAFDDNWGCTHVFHPIDWKSSKKRRVSHSSYGAEILACADADERGFYVKQALK